MELRSQIRLVSKGSSRVNGALGGKECVCTCVCERGQTVPLTYQTMEVSFGEKG